MIDILVGGTAPNIDTPLGGGPAVVAGSAPNIDTGLAAVGGSVFTAPTMDTGRAAVGARNRIKKKPISLKMECPLPNGTYLL